MSDSTETLVMGAVAYDPKVVTIWDGFKRFFAERGLDFDFVLYENYERQVKSHLDGHLHLAWNSPLAWIQTVRAAKLRGRTAEAIAMRDTDRDLTSVIVTRKDSGIESLADLEGKALGVGAGDSPQATLIPLEHIAASQGWTPDEHFKVRRFDRLVGKHGDHIGGERDAAKALMAGEVDACAMIDGNHLLFTTEGTLPTDGTTVIAQTGTYDHCNFTVLDDAPKATIEKFVELLMSMRYDDPEVRPLLDLEGLKAWTPGRTEGYALLDAAVDRFGYLDAFLAELS